MQRLKIWDKQSDLYPVSGGKKTPEEVFEMYGWTEHPDITVVVDDTYGIWRGTFNLAAEKARYGIETDDDNEAVRQLEAIFYASSPEPAPPVVSVSEQFIGGMLEVIGKEENVTMKEMGRQFASDFMKVREIDAKSRIKLEEGVIEIEDNVIAIKDGEETL